MLRKVRLTLGMLCLVFAVVRRFHGRASCMARLDCEDTVSSGSAGVECRCNRVFDITHADSGQGVLFGDLSVGGVSGCGGSSGPGKQEDALHVFQAEKLAALRCAGDAVGCACPGRLARPVCRVRPCGTQFSATFVDVGKQPAGFYGRTHGQLCLLFGGCLAQESAGADSGSGHAGTGGGTGGTQRTYLL